MKIDGKLGFICVLLGDSGERPEEAERFCRGTHIDFGDHPDAEARCDLLLFVLWMTTTVSRRNRNRTKRAMGEINRWFSSDIEAFGGDPVTYLINADDFDRVAWVRHAMNTLQWGSQSDGYRYHSLTDAALDHLMSMEGVAPALASRGEYVGEYDWPFSR